LESIGTTSFTINSVSLSINWRIGPISKYFKMILSPGLAFKSSAAQRLRMISLLASEVLGIEETKE
jgi:hypothetical protein